MLCKEKSGNPARDTLCFRNFYKLISAFHFCLDLLQVADIWRQKLAEEQGKTAPLEQECAALREDLDAQHKKRIEALEIKMKPIIVKDGPSKKVAFQSSAQGCQRLFSNTKNPALGICSSEGLEGKNVGIFYGHVVIL
jgi:hypothetical protein